MFKRYEEFGSIPLVDFSQALQVAFSNEGVKYQLTSVQEKTILDKLGSSTVRDTDPHTGILCSTYTLSLSVFIYTPWLFRHSIGYAL